MHTKEQSSLTEILQIIQSDREEEREREREREGQEKKGEITSERGRRIHFFAIFMSKRH